MLSERFLVQVVEDSEGENALKQIVGLGIVSGPQLHEISRHVPLLLILREEGIVELLQEDSFLQGIEVHSLRDLARGVLNQGLEQEGGCEDDGVALVVEETKQGVVSGRELLEDTEADVLFGGLGVRVEEDIEDLEDGIENELARAVCNGLVEDVEEEGEEVVITEEERTILLLILDGAVLLAPQDHVFDALENPIELFVTLTLHAEKNNIQGGLVINVSRADCRPVQQDRKALPQEESCGVQDLLVLVLDLASLNELNEGSIDVGIRLFVECLDRSRNGNVPIVQLKKPDEGLVSQEEIWITLVDVLFNDGKEVGRGTSDHREEEGRYIDSMKDFVVSRENRTTFPKSILSV